MIRIQIAAIIMAEVNIHKLIYRGYIYEDKSLFPVEDWRKVKSIKYD